MNRDELIKMLMELPPDAKVFVYDSGCGCCSEGLVRPEIVKLDNNEERYQM